MMLSGYYWVDASTRLYNDPKVEEVLTQWIVVVSRRNLKIYDRKIYPHIHRNPSNKANFSRNKITTIRAPIKTRKHDAYYAFKSYTHLTNE